MPTVGSMSFFKKSTAKDRHSGQRTSYSPVAHGTISNPHRKGNRGLSEFDEKRASQTAGVPAAGIPAGQHHGAPNPAVGQSAGQYNGTAPIIDIQRAGSPRPHKEIFVQFSGNQNANVATADAKAPSPSPDKPGISGAKSGGILSRVSSPGPQNGLPISSGPHGNFETPEQRLVSGKYRNALNEIKELERELDELGKAYQDEQRTTKLLKQELKDMADVAAVDAQNAESKIARLQNERENLRKRVIAMEDYFKIEGVTFEDLEKMGVLKEELTASQSMNNTMRIRINELRDQNNARQDQVDALKRRMGQMEAAYEGEISNMAARHTEDMKEIEKLREKLEESMKSQMQVLDKSMEDSKQTADQILSYFRALARKVDDQLQERDRQDAARKTELLREIHALKGESGKKTEAPETPKSEKQEAAGMKTSTEKKEPVQRKESVNGNKPVAAKK